MPQIYIGVDLSLQNLDVWMGGKYKRYDNTEAGLRKFLKDVSKLNKTVLVAFESTGSISLYFVLSFIPADFPQQGRAVQTSAPSVHSPGASVPPGALTDTPRHRLHRQQYSPAKP